jgi:hypothetical protein
MRYPNLFELSGMDYEILNFKDEIHVKGGRM